MAGLWVVGNSLPTGPALVPAGEVSAQRVLTYPAFNAVVDAHCATLFGPDSSVQMQELRGTSWAVGVLFRPAAGRLLTATEPADVPASGEHLPEAPVQAMAAVMNAMNRTSAARLALEGILKSWLSPYVSGLDEKATLVNAVCRLAETDERATRAISTFPVTTRK